MTEAGRVSLSPLDPALDKRPRLLWALVAALLCTAFVLRVQNLAGQSLWFDEIIQVRMTRKPLLWTWRHLFGWLNEMPLDHTLQHFSVRWGGETELWIRFPAVIWGTLTTLVLFLWTRSALGPTAGLLSMAALAFSAFHITYSREGRPYALWVLVTTLAVWGLWELTQRRESRGRWWAVFAGSAVAMILTHFLTPVTLTLMLAWVGGWWAVTTVRRSERRASLLRVGLGALVIWSMCALTVVINWGRVSGTDMYQATLPYEPLSALQVVRLAGVFVFGQQIGLQPTVTVWALLPLAGVGVLWGFVRRPALTSLLAMLWAGSLFGILTLCWVTDHWFAERYCIGALVPSTIFLAMGFGAAVNGLSRQVPRGARVALCAVLTPGLLVLGGVLAAGWSILNPYPKTDWRGFVNWLADQSGHATPILTNHEWTQLRLDYYLVRLGIPRRCETWRGTALCRRAEELGQVRILGGNPEELHGEVLDWLWGRPVPWEQFTGLRHWHCHDPAARPRSDPEQLASALSQFTANGHRLDVGHESFDAIGEGWGAAEVFNWEFPFRWTGWEQAQVALPVSEPRDSVLLWRASAFNFPGAPPLRAAVQLNGVEVGQGIITWPWAIHGVRVSAELLHSGINMVEFQTDESVSPAHLTGNDDRRYLAMAVDWITLMPDDGMPLEVDEVFEPAQGLFTPQPRLTGSRHWHIHGSCETLRARLDLREWALQQFAQDGHRIDIGAESFDAVGTGWHGAEEFNGEFPFRWTQEIYASLALPVAGTRDSTVVWRAHGFQFPGANPLRVSVRVNGAELGRGDLSQDWQIHAVVVSEELLHAGINEVSFMTDGCVVPAAVMDSNDERPLGMAVDWLALEPGTVPPPEAERVLRPGDGPFVPRDRR